MSRIVKWILGTCISCALTSAFALAQTTSTARISGRVTDATGAILPGADVKVTQTDTGLVRNVITNESGLYTMPNLPVGSYTLEIGLPGFRTFVQSGIVLQVNASLVIDAALQVGEVSQTIEVQANSELQVETRSMGVGTVIENQRILELPLNGRQVTDLITLSGAAVQTGSSPAWGMSTGVNISVAGGQRIGVAYTLDGATHTNPYDATNMPTPFPDALQEFRVNTSSQGAETGRASGAAVTSVTRSGTNAFHGSAFWFVRNAVFNAREADATAKDQLKRNQFGGTIGGPVLRNRLFFFSGFQGTTVRTEPSTTLSIVPTAAMLSGDWTEFNRCYEPQWSDADFRDGTVNPSRYSPAARALAARLPAPNGTCGEIRWGTRAVQNDKQTVNRIDFRQSDNHTIFGRYMATFQDSPAQFNENNLLTANVRGTDDLAQSGTIGSNYIIGPDTINSFVFAYNRIALVHKGAEFFSPGDVDINMWSNPEKHFSLSTSGHFSFGSGVNSLLDLFNNQYQVSDDVSLNRGSHQIAFGANWWRTEVDGIAFVRSVGNLSIDGNVTGNAMGDFFLGRLQQIRQAMPNPLHLHQHYIGLYATDTWRVTPRVTFNYGVRWEPFLPMVGEPTRTNLASIDPAHNGGVRMYNFDPERFRAGQKSIVFPTAPAGFIFASQGDGPADPGFIGNSGVRTQWAKFAPRVGLAWDPTGAGQTSVRAGFGIAYDVVNMQLMHNAANVAPWSADTIYRNSSLDNPWQGFPGGNPFPFDFRQTPTFPAGSVFVPMNPDNDMTAVHSWNLSVQQRLQGSWLVSASYLGSQTAHLWATRAANPSLILTSQTHPSLFTGPNICVLEGRSYAPCNQLGNVNQRRELRLWAAMNRPELLNDATLFSFIDPNASEGTASYHGLLTSVRGIVRGVNLNANYTWSRCISDRTNEGVPNPAAAYNVGRDRGNCGADRRHLFNFTAVATTPQFANPSLRNIASDWRLSVIYRVSSGNYLTVTSGLDRALTGNGGQTADQVLADVFADRSGGLGTQYLNPAAFANPALGTQGNMRTFSIPGLGTWDLDMAISRAFRAGDSQRFEIRAEAFNITNTVRGNDPSTSLRSGNFGRITGSRDPRIMQFALKYVF